MFVLAVTASLLLPSCAVKGLAFHQDDRLKIVEPKNHSVLTLPVTVRWETTGFHVTGPNGTVDPNGGYFAVFFDRAPQPPGKPISWLARDDPRCHARFGCPDAKWFSGHNIYPTTSNTFTIDSLPIFTKQDREQFHDVTIVLLDGTGSRIGESAYWVEFRVTGQRSR